MKYNNYVTKNHEYKIKKKEKEKKELYFENVLLYYFILTLFLN